MKRENVFGTLLLALIVSLACFITYALTKKSEEDWYAQHPRYPSRIGMIVNGHKVFCASLDNVNYQCDEVQEKFLIHPDAGGENSITTYRCRENCAMNANEGALDGSVREAINPKEYEDVKEPADAMYFNLLVDSTPRGALVSIKRRGEPYDEVTRLTPVLLRDVERALWYIRFEKDGYVTQEYVFDAMKDTRKGIDVQLKKIPE